MPARASISLLLGAAAAVAAPGATSPGAIVVAFGSDATTSATISFAGNSSGAAGTVWLSPAPARWASSSSSSSSSAAAAAACAGAPAGAASLPAAASDHSYANSAGLQTVYRAQLSGLAPGTTYTYGACWAGGSASAPRSFTTLAVGANPKVIYWGDLGRDGGGQAFPALEGEAAATAARAAGAGDVAIAAGDHAYNLCDFNGARGAAWMERFSNISAYLPVWTVLGNHELPSDCKVDFNASHYVNMLGRNMPGGTNGSYYSVDLGQTHIVFLSSEVIALGPYGGVTAAAQSAWLAADLAAVDRARTPWVLAVLHRPFYCSNANSWCGARAWQGNAVRLELEPLLLAGGVDVVLAGHEHSVELTWPVKAGAATQLNYDAPAAPVHSIAGAAGCNEQHGDCLNPMGAAAGSWSRARLAGDPQQYGYSRFWAVNASHWHFEQVQTSLPGGPVLWSEAVDIVQPSHGPFRA